jgi:hypothetical protein
MCSAWSTHGPVWQIIWHHMAPTSSPYGAKRGPNGIKKGPNGIRKLLQRASKNGSNGVNRVPNGVEKCPSGIQKGSQRCQKRSPAASKGTPAAPKGALTVPQCPLWHPCGPTYVSHVVPISSPYGAYWLPYGPHMGLTSLPRDAHMASVWQSCGPHMSLIWLPYTPYSPHVVPPRHVHACIWSLSVPHIVTVWRPHGPHTARCGTHQGFIWFPYGLRTARHASHVVVIWSVSGTHVVPIRYLYGPGPDMHPRWSLLRPTVPIAESVSADAESTPAARSIRVPECVACWGSNDPVPLVGVRDSESGGRGSPPPSPWACRCASRAPSPMRSHAASMRSRRGRLMCSHDPPVHFPGPPITATLDPPKRLSISG